MLYPSSPQHSSFGDLYLQISALYWGSYLLVLTEPMLPSLVPGIKQAFRTYSPNDGTIGPAMLGHGPRVD